MKAYKTVKLNDQYSVLFDSDKPSHLVNELTGVIEKITLSVDDTLRPVTPLYDDTGAIRPQVHSYIQKPQLPRLFNDDGSLCVYNPC